MARAASGSVLRCGSVDRRVDGRVSPRSRLLIISDLGDSEIKFVCTNCDGWMEGFMKELMSKFPTKMMGVIRAKVRVRTIAVIKVANDWIS